MTAARWSNVDARIANRHQIFAFERLAVEIRHEVAVSFLQEDLRPVHLLDHRLRRFSLTEARQRYLVADLAHGAAHRLGRLFFLGGNIELHAALRQPLHRQLHACASPVSRTAGGSTNRRAVSTGPQNASRLPQAASMLRNLAGGLPTGEYSRRYPGPNSWERPVQTVIAWPGNSMACIDSLSRDLSRSLAGSVAPDQRSYGRCQIVTGDGEVSRPMIAESLPIRHRIPHCVTS